MWSVTPVVYFAYFWQNVEILTWLLRSNVHTHHTFTSEHLFSMFRFT
jgi:hypothetical protein